MMPSQINPVLALQPAAARLHQNGEVAARTILGQWKGPALADACVAALQLGMLNAGNLLAYHRCRQLLESNLDLHKVNQDRWPEVLSVFHQGRDTIITRSEVWSRYIPKPANDNDRFQVTWFDDVNKSPAKDEIVKGVIGAGEFSLWVAKPGTAKSVLLCDIGCHIAAGLDWHGRKVKQGLTVFFAAERKGLTERRIAAWRKTHGVTGIPFAVVGGKLDLTTGLIDAKALAAAIKGLEDKSGLPCRLIILDTVTRTFGSGDQNSSKDMQRFIQSADELTRATGSHVAAIHHSGWVGDRGKGAVDLDGAVDVSYGVSVIGKGPAKVFKLECTGANDGDEGDITSFRLDSVELGTDADGNVTTAPVVVQVDGAKHDGSNLKGNTAKALDSLRRAIQEHGQCAPDGSPGFTDGVPTASRDEWREQFYADARAKEPDLKDATLRSRFNRAIEELVDKAESVETVGDRFWTVASVA
ncbi:AAA family ATPase [Bradyrhizobium sp. SSUT112]|uniref:AAA family ATPase n=1 Tax=Bradyrhizobium sp. SSUT112 TaxID=3040604 RepID=UPI00244906D6|nr:AAA family ATPase [Bradyrhizobium sp. SSUT112]MDH2354894.1 AAA family ATPase [Bradyrhizobium sp. SSUT112]